MFTTTEPLRALLNWDTTGALLDPWGNPVPEWMLQTAGYLLLALFVLGGLALQHGWESEKDREFEERAERLGFVRAAKPEQQHTPEPAPPAEPLERMPLREIITPDGMPAGGLLGATTAALILGLNIALNGWATPGTETIFVALGAAAAIIVLTCTRRLILRRALERRSGRGETVAPAPTGANA